MTTLHGSLESKFRTEAGVNPISPVEGDMFYDTTNNRLMRFDGTRWRGLGFTTSTSTTTTSTSSSTTTSTSSSTSITTSTTITYPYHFELDPVEDKYDIDRSDQ